MSSLVEEAVKKLTNTVDSLESRIKALEDRAAGGSGKLSTEEVRMILIGPPGAGMPLPSSLFAFNHPVATFILISQLTHRQGHPSPQDQGEV